MRTIIRNNYDPKTSDYHETLVIDDERGKKYLFDCDGVFTDITNPKVVSETGNSEDYAASQKWVTEIQGDLADETQNRTDADDAIWAEIEEIEMSSDVVDIVGTYAELQQYDTSHLKDNDIIKVLSDETHQNETAYYRFSTSTSTFSYVGSEGPYYTESEIDTMMADKQDTLIAGANIQIASDGKTISATDTTYTHFTGATASTDGVQGLVPGPLAGDENKVLKGDGTWGDGATYTAGTGIDITGSSISIDLTAGSNVQINGSTISATDTTYSVFTGATTLSNGTSGLVPAPTTSDVNKVLKGDGTWSEVAANTIFYMNAAESGGTRHIYKNPDMTDAATSQEVFDANDQGQVILRISTSVTPEMYSDAYLQNAYKATGDYQLLFLDEKTYRSFDTTNLSDSVFTYNARVLQDQLTAGANIQINGATISATDTTYSAFGGATSSVAGSAGLVPAPTTSDPDKFLKGDGTWASLPAANNISSNDWSGLWL